MVHGLKQGEMTKRTPRFVPNREMEDSIEAYSYTDVEHDLLTAEEEIELAELMEEGAKAAAALEAINGGLTAEEREEFELLVAKGAKARDVFVLSNSGLAIDIASRYRRMPVPFVDLIQFGQIGLVKAVDKFDHRKGFRFSTYATWWIKETITRGISEQSRTIKLPDAVSDRVYDVNLKLESKRPEEITQEAIEDVGETFSPSELLYLNTLSSPLSLNTPIDEGHQNMTEKGDLIPDKAAVNPEDEAVLKDSVERIYQQLFDVLTDEERQIVVTYLGLGTNEPMSFSAIARLLEMTDSKVSLMYKKALNKLQIKNGIRKPESEDTWRAELRAQKTEKQL